MRGVASGGMVLALERMGLRDAFDAAYGSSAGAFNAAYFLTGQAFQALPLYSDAMASGFFDLRRALRRRPVLSVEWVLDVGMVRLVPLDWAGVLGSDVELQVIASSIDELRPIAFRTFSSRADLRTALLASARIPFLAGAPVSYRGHELLDAAVLQAHPYQTAVDDGCTHILSLSTRPRGHLRGSVGPTERLTAARLERLRHRLGARHLERDREYPRVQERLRTLTDGPDMPPFVLDVAPDHKTEEVRHLERDLRRLLAGARAGYEAAHLAVEGREVRSFIRLDHKRSESGHV
jgi:predicted patatin/cPLA2 family phospholipase